MRIDFGLWPIEDYRFAVKLLTLGILKKYWETGRVPSLYDWGYNFVVLLSVGFVVLVVLPDLAADSCLR